MFELLKPATLMIETFQTMQTSCTTGITTSRKHPDGFNAQTLPNREEKYLPSLRSYSMAKGQGRMKEFGEWHRFLEVFMSWLALIDKTYVSEMRPA